jgi:hypothetical protein
MVLPENRRPSFGLKAVKGIFLDYCHPQSLAYKILHRGTICNSGHVYFNEDLTAITPPDDDLINDIKVFFNHLNDNQTYHLTDADIHDFSRGRDSNDKLVSPADDPSYRPIQDVVVDEPATPVSRRTR